jgi:hypothetical protein
VLFGNALEMVGDAVKAGGSLPRARQMERVCLVKGKADISCLETNLARRSFTQLRSVNPILSCVI